MASLNGVHMFLKNQNTKLLTTDTPDSIVTWKEFYGSIILIAIASGTTQKVINTFLQSIFDTMVLTVGINEVKNPKSIERLKKDLRSCYPIIDKLLECLDVVDRTNSKTDLIGMTDCIMSSENHLLQIGLEGYLDFLESSYGCLLIHDCTAVATDNWWSLEMIERKLLVLAAMTNSNYTAKDLPVYLPYKSPEVPYRLVIITLFSNVQALALCGPTPDLGEIEKQAVHCWKNSLEILRLAEQCYPRNFPPSVNLDSGILGFLLVNCKIGKFVLSQNIQHPKNHASSSHRLEILRSFYHFAVEAFLIQSDLKKHDKEVFSKAKETYWCSEYHKCHAVREGDQILCCLYTASVPTHTIRLISQKTLKSLLVDRQVCW